MFVCERECVCVRECVYTCMCVYCVPNVSILTLY